MQLTFPGEDAERDVAGLLGTARVRPSRWEGSVGDEDRRRLVGSGVGEGFGEDGSEGAGRRRGWGVRRRVT